MCHHPGEKNAMNSMRASGGTIDAFAALRAGQPLQAYRYVPKELGANEVEVAVSHCGMCHTDLHLMNNDFGFLALPLILAEQSIVMSPVGSRSEIKAMLDFSARHSIGPQVEVVPIREVDSVLARLAANELRYRSVLTN
jgi:D-arabinose 1-dehydrogenase-like Zn-dependent alcohol dehydrogenase